MNLRTWSPSQVPITPLIFDLDYLNSFKEVIYFGNKRGEYSENPKNIKYIIVNQEDYRVDSTNPFDRSDPNPEVEKDIEFYSFGILINLFNARLIPLDFDNNTQENVDLMAKKFLINEEVIAADIIQSSSGKYHLLIGLKEFRNINGFIGLIPGVCEGFAGCSNDKREAVLRTSQKFYPNGRQTKSPIILKAYRVVEDKVLYSTYITTQFTKNETKKKNLSLRGYNEHI